MQYSDGHGNQTRAGGDDSRSRASSTSRSGGRRYKLTIRQQPLRGRQCALGSRDRRPIDPPPIVQLTVYKPDGTIDDNANADSVFSLQTILEPLTSDDDVRGHGGNAGTVSTAAETMTDTPLPAAGRTVTTKLSHSSLTRRLEGKTYSSAHIVKDLDASSLSTFFVFPDLTVRDEGVFALRFRLIVLGGPPSEDTAPSLGAGAGRKRRCDNTSSSSPPPPPQTDQSAPPMPISKTAISSLLSPVEPDDPGPATANRNPSNGWHAAAMPSPSSTAPTPAIPRVGAASTGDTGNALGATSSPMSMAGAIMSEVVSEPFENFSPKNFPGSLESTPLTRTLAAQGVLAPIRNFGSSGARRLSRAD
ncbi:unnamed protein product [Parajaminaea phylloscopi]